MQIRLGEQVRQGRRAGLEVVPVALRIPDRDRGVVRVGERDSAYRAGRDALALADPHGDVGQARDSDRADLGEQGPQRPLGAPHERPALELEHERDDDDQPLPAFGGQRAAGLGQDLLVAAEHAHVDVGQADRRDAVLDEPGGDGRTGVRVGDQHRMARELDQRLLERGVLVGHIQRFARGGRQRLEPPVADGDDEHVLAAAGPSACGGVRQRSGVVLAERRREVLGDASASHGGLEVVGGVRGMGGSSW